MARLRIWAVTFLLSLGVLGVASTVHIVLGTVVPTVWVEEPPGDFLRKPDPYAPRIPHNNASAVHRVAEDLGEESLKRFTELKVIPIEDMTEDQFFEFELFGHIGLGAGIRNRFGLWEDSRLARYYFWRGYRHPDDMSALILDELADYVDGTEPTNLYPQRVLVLVILAVLLTVGVRTSLALFSLCSLVLRRLSNKASEVTPNGAPPL